MNEKKEKIKRNTMKKVLLVGFSVIGLALSAVAGYQNSEKEVITNQLKCMFCNGTGWNGSFKCIHCNGTGGK